MDVNSVNLRCVFMNLGWCWESCVDGSRNVVKNVRSCVLWCGLVNFVQVCYGRNV